MVFSIPTSNVVSGYQPSSFLIFSGSMCLEFFYQTICFCSFKTRLNLFLVIPVHTCTTSTEK